MSSTPFQSLIAELAPDLGLAADPDIQGLEFESDGFVLTVTEHPFLTGRLLLQIAIMTLDEEMDSSLPLALHQVNELARFEHEWLITIDVDRELFLSRSVSLEGIDAANLKRLLLDGLDRAQHLAQGILATEFSDDPHAQVQLGPLLGSGQASI